MADSPTEEVETYADTDKTNFDTEVSSLPVLRGYLIRQSAYATSTKKLFNVFYNKYLYSSCVIVPAMTG